MHCCSQKKHFSARGNKITLFSNHGRQIHFTRELMDEIKKYKIVETGFYFNQKLEINERKRKRDETFVESISNYFNKFFKYQEPEEGLPNNVEELILNFPFNHPIDNLPASIKKIKFAKTFNQPIDNLPQGLKKIKFYYLGDFNQPIDFLPSSLEFLELPNIFNHPIDNLPSSLKFLKLGSNFKKEINNLPDSLETLILPSSYGKEIKKFPRNLRQIVISDDYEFSIPEEVERKKRISVKYYNYDKN